MLLATLRALALVSVLGALALGCPSPPPTCSAGTETCPCYGNGTCNEGLLCLSNLCVTPPQSDASDTPLGRGPTDTFDASEPPDIDDAFANAADTPPEETAATDIPPASDVPTDHGMPSPDADAGENSMDVSPDPPGPDADAPIVDATVDTEPATDSGAGADSANGETDSSEPPDGPQRVVGYYTSWSIYGRDFQVADLPGDKLTHINYAFANLDANGNCLLGDPWADKDKAIANDAQAPFKGNFYQLALLKQQNPNLKTLLSVGGWTWSDHFSTVAATQAGRQAMAQSCVDLVRTYGFDGLDVDWEYPVSGGEAGNSQSPNDTSNYTLLLQTVRDTFDAYEAADGKDYLLTIAAPAGSSLVANFDIPGLVAVLDWINIMAYDLAGSWDAQTGFNAPLYAPADAPNPDYNVNGAVEAYLAAGAPPDQLVLGTPFYGRGFAGVPVTPSNGLHVNFAGTPAGTWESGVFDYDDLAANYLTNGQYATYWSDEAQVPWLFSPTLGVFISYDDASSLQAKGAYIKAHGLGGAMIWEMSCNRDDTLLDALLSGMQ